MREKYCAALAKKAPPPLSITAFSATLPSLTTHTPLKKYVWVVRETVSDVGWGSNSSK